MTHLESPATWLDESYFFEIAWRQTWQLTLLAALVALVVRLCCRQRPRLAYLLWMLVIIKAMTPPIVASPVGPMSWLCLAESPVATTGDPRIRVTGAPQADSRQPVPLAVVERPSETSFHTDAEVQSTDNARHGWPSFALTVIVAWLVGVLLLGPYVVAKWFRFARCLKETEVAVPHGLRALVDEQAALIGLRRSVSVRVTTLPTAPAALGILRPTVVLPDSLLAVDDATTLQPIVAHELLHIRRWDTLAGVVQLMVQVIWWFHPLVWLANRELRRLRERCCDEEVLAYTRCKPADYARSLLSVVEMACIRPSLTWAIGASSGEMTACRIAEIMQKHRVAKRHTPAGYWLIVGLAALFALPGAPVTQLGAAPTEPTTPAPAEGPDRELTPDTAAGPGAAGIGVRNVPPVVVKTQPQSGSDGVDPALKRIEVTFSKRMADRSWSWVQLGEKSFPETIGEPRYLDGRRTCVMDVDLKPNRTYAIWLNTDKYRNFRDTAGQSAIPYLLVFRTAGEQ